MSLLETDDKGRTCLHHFTSHGNFDAVSYIVSHEFSLLEVPDKNGKTALYYAAKIGNNLISKLFISKAEFLDGNLLLLSSLFPFPLPSTLLFLRRKYPSFPFLFAFSFLCAKWHRNFLFRDYNECGEERSN